MTLQELCQQKLINNLKYIEDLGDLQNHLAKPILTRMKPPQLLKIESLNPYYKSLTGPLWYSFIVEEFPKYKFTENTNFGEIYWDLKNQLELKRANALKNLKKNYKLIENEKLENSTVHLNQSASIKMVDLVYNKKRKKMFNNQSEIMKKVKKDEQMRKTQFNVPYPMKMLSNNDNTLMTNSKLFPKKSERKQTKISSLFQKDSKTTSSNMKISTRIVTVKKANKSPNKSQKLKSPTFTKSGIEFFEPKVLSNEKKVRNSRNNKLLSTGLFINRKR